MKNIKTHPNRTLFGKVLLFTPILFIFGCKKPNIDIVNVEEQKAPPDEIETIIEPERDKFLIHKGQYAARINGTIWMRLNLGADLSSSNPDAIPMSLERHGDYYQWGRKISSANSSSDFTVTFFGDDAPPNDAWNAGNETHPIKTDNDPCPQGYRIPTRMELEDLIKSTETINIGKLSHDFRNYAVAKIFTSRNNNKVKLTFPFQGYLTVRYGPDNNYLPSGIWNRGIEGYFYSSRSTNATFISVLKITENNVCISNMTFERKVKFKSANIRCVAE
ncbi:hypothetical protein ACL9RF_05280 [Sphingobacterium sp. Mn56C]|uniref:hypothetical protein n=1 Tax=Sphingobacterium sp. Mn56C TaxID=3395261 RepID=UPI003BD30FC8